MRFSLSTAERGRSEYFKGILLFGLLKHKYGPNSGLWSSCEWTPLLTVLRGDHQGGVEGRSQCKRFQLRLLAWQLGYLHSSPSITTHVTEATSQPPQSDVLMALMMWHVHETNSAWWSWWHARHDRTRHETLHDTRRCHFIVLVAASRHYAFVMKYRCTRASSLIICATFRINIFILM